jgi:hypothetical protein
LRMFLITLLRTGLNWAMAMLKLMADSRKGEIELENQIE